MLKRSIVDVRLASKYASSLSALEYFFKKAADLSVLGNWLVWHSYLTNLKRRNFQPKNFWCFPPKYNSLNEKFFAPVWKNRSSGPPTQKFFILNRKNFQFFKRKKTYSPPKEKIYNNYQKKQFSKQKISYICKKKLNHFILDAFLIRLFCFLCQQNLTN